MVGGSKIGRESLALRIASSAITLDAAASSPRAASVELNSSPDALDRAPYFSLNTPLLVAVNAGDVATSGSVFDQRAILIAVGRWASIDAGGDWVFSGG
jgi:hypothetical protein